MPLTLITGPANAAKAGAVLERLRAALPRDPVLVVPTAADVAHYQRELAGSGIVFGADVLTFARLMGEIAARAGLIARPLGRVARERVVGAAIADVPLRVLARSAATPGFADAAGALFAELQRSLVAPARFTSALRAWAAAESESEVESEADDGGRSARAAYAAEVAALYAGYRRRLEALGRPDPEGYAWAALDALRAAPASWGTRPVFLYGFDDLTPTERDAVETLVRHAGVEVCVALPYEPGRVAFAGRAATVEELRPSADEVVHLPERAEHYAPAARPALHHLERRLYEPGSPRRAPNGAIRLLEAGGERAEAELVGAEVLELMRQGVEPADVAVILRGDAGTAALFAQVLAGYGIPVSHDRRVRLEHTRLGAGVLAAVRAALPDGTAADLLTWLRTPGCVADAAPVDRLEAMVRRRELRGVAAARAAWEGLGDGAVLGRLDALAAAAEEGAEALLAAVEAEADALWTAPHHRRGEVLPAEDLADARVAGDLRSAAAELRGLAAVDPALLGTAADVVEALAAVRVREPSAVAGAALGTPAEAALVGSVTRSAPGLGQATVSVFGRSDEPGAVGDPLAMGAATPAAGGAVVAPRDVDPLAAGAAAPPAGVLLADPLAIRARRFRAVFVCGLQEGEFPRRPEPEPFLSDEDRRGLARASGLRLPMHEDVLDRERSLFYAAVSRPEAALFLSWRSSDEEGDPLVPSPFFDDVRALFTDELWESRGTRMLADVTWAPKDAPTPHELRRAYAAAREEPEPPPLAAPRTSAVRSLLAERETEPARGVEAFAACGVRWLVEQVLRPERTEPDPEPMRRGALGHAVLERALRLLAERTGSARVTPDSLADAVAALRDALAEETRGAGGSARRRALLHGLKADLERYLRREAACGAGYEPARMEWRFGGANDEHGPLRLGEGEGAVTGRVDRLDVAPDGRAIVVDYKGAAVVAGARWADQQQLQVALYLLAVRTLLGHEPAAGVYQPLAGRKLEPRGLVRGDVPGRYVRTDVVDDAAFDAALEDVRGLAARTIADIRAGRIRPCPERCSARGCRYPGICRAGEGDRGAGAPS
jgi:ATP-dependent helicase/DNAse subunit B